MSEKKNVFASEMKYSGILDFREFYKFCYEWLSDEEDLDIIETKYEEKIKGNEKELVIKWTADKKLTDYFKKEFMIEFTIRKMKDVEIAQDGKKIKMNEANVKVKVKGNLIKDYDGKFEKDAYRKFLRGIYEKWVIASQVQQFEVHIINKSDEFLLQAKAFLDLEGKR